MKRIAYLASFILLVSTVARANLGDWTRSLVAIVIANLASFGFGEIMNSYGWFGPF